MPSLGKYRPLIAELAAKPITPSTVLALRKQVGDEWSRELLDIISIQAKARKKFGDGVWMATARSIEQASDQVVANYKASLMGDRVIIDLCGGIGGDAMAFAKRGGVITIDRDPRMTMMAAENLSSLGASNAAAVCANVTKYLSPEAVADHRVGFHIDPDRRPHDRRTSAPEAYEPSFAFVSYLIASSSACMVKLAPAAELDEASSANVHRQWISFAGSVREQTLSAGECIDRASLQPGHRSAVRLKRDGSRQTFATTGATEFKGVKSAGSPLRFIVDLDPAVRASGLSVAFANAHNLHCLGEPSGFFTRDQPTDAESLMQCYEVLWAGPADMKQIRKQLKQQSIQLQSIKVRSTDHDPAALMRKLAVHPLDANLSATLLLSRTRDGAYAVLATPHLGLAE
jgi:hypothetical protein